MFLRHEEQLEKERYHHYYYSQAHRRRHYPLLSWNPVHSPRDSSRSSGKVYELDTKRRYKTNAGQVQVIDYDHKTKLSSRPWSNTTVAQAPTTRGNPVLEKPTNSTSQHLITVIGDGPDGTAMEKATNVTRQNLITVIGYRPRGTCQQKMHGKT